MKKKIVFALMAVIVLATFVLTSCGNVSIGFGNYNFRKVHVHLGNYSKCLEIINWHDNELGIEVKTKEFGTLYLSEGTYVLVEDKCPICDKVGK